MDKLTKKERKVAEKELAAISIESIPATEEALGGAAPKGLSPRAKEIQKIITDGGFQCRKKTVLELIGKVIGEDISAGRNRDFLKPLALPPFSVLLRKDGYTWDRVVGIDGHVYYTDGDIKNCGRINKDYVTVPTAAKVRSFYRHLQDPTIKLLYSSLCRARAL